MSHACFSDSNHIYDPILENAVSQEILPLGIFAAAANFPRKHGSVVSGERQHFLVIIAALGNDAAHNTNFVSNAEGA